ncbi:MAG: hypothetical protein V4813_00570 [Gemmatimonadota bacterium]
MQSRPEEERIAALEREVRQQRRMLGVVGGVFVAVTVLAGFAPATRDVIRTRGIVIVDDKGRERILIGAPIPAAANRLRTNTARAERAWASRFPDPKQYMRWYADYRHSMHGMLVLDEQGHDRLAIGDSTPDPNIGKRLGASTGLVVNDAEGFERTGYGMLTVAGKDRVVLGLDGKDGEEAVVLSVHDDGRAGLSVSGAGRRSIFLGQSPAAVAQGGRDSSAGLVLRRGDVEAHRLSTDDARRPD